MINTQINYYLVEPAIFDFCKDSVNLVNFLNHENQVPSTLKGDHLRLKQVLINLLKNSLKFCQNGLIHIVMAYDNESKLIRVHVVDNGKGIKPENMPKLFK